MNTRSWGIAIVLVICAAAIGCVTYQYPPSSSRPVVTDVAPAGGSDQPFYDDLAPYGRWVQVAGPGWVWSPYNVQAGWRPYQLGHWVFTDYGWTWSSDEQWGWAVYHYGRWDHNPTYGWVWVPGTEWGPAWVAWHEGGGYVGWAPLPWQVRFRADVGLDWGSVNVSIDSSWWCFVGARNLVDTSLRNVIVPASRNVSLIQITKNVTNYTYIDNRVVNQGVKVEKIARVVGRTIPRYRVMDEDSPGVGRGGKVRGQDFIVFRPDARRDHKSEGRDAPRGRDQQDRARDIRRAAEEARQQTAPPPAPPEPTTTRPPAPSEPPAPPPGRETKDDDHKSRQGRGRKFLDEMMGKQPPHHRAPEKPAPTQPQAQDQPPTAASQPSGESAPPAEARPDSAPSGDRHDAATPPARPDPEKARTGRDKAKDARDAAVRGRKQKPDAAKADDKKDDKKQEDPKQEKHDSED